MPCSRTPTYSPCSGQAWMESKTPRPRSTRTCASATTARKPGSRPSTTWNPETAADPSAASPPAALSDIDVQLSATHALGNLSRTANPGRLIPAVNVHLDGQMILKPVRRDPDPTLTCGNL